jgi:hypothetical protein
MSEIISMWGLAVCLVLENWGITAPKIIFSKKRNESRGEKAAKLVNDYLKSLQELSNLLEEPKHGKRAEGSPSPNST